MAQSSTPSSLGAPYMLTRTSWLETDKYRSSLSSIDGYSSQSIHCNKTLLPALPSLSQFFNLMYVSGSFNV